MDHRTNSDSRPTDEDSQSDRAEEPVRRKILGIDPDRFSILTGTDSTMSNRTGAGRTLDGWLSQGGRLIDTAVTAATSHIGTGSTYEMQRSPTVGGENRLDQDVAYNSISNDTTSNQQRQNYPEREHAPVRRTLPGIDSDLYSILTGTDSTMSNLTGAGRTIYGWLSRGGCFVDTAVTAAASRIGAGPTPLFKRLLIPRALRFISANCHCNTFPSRSEVVQLAERDIAPAKARSRTGDREPEWKISLRMAINLTQRFWCPSCHRGYELVAATTGPSFTQDCHSMIKFIQRNANPTSRELALFYIYLLWYLNPEFKRATSSSDFGFQLSLLDSPVSLVTEAFSNQSAWLASELRLMNDASLRPGVLPTVVSVAYGWNNLRLSLDPVNDDSGANFMIRLFDGLATTAKPYQHGSLISGLIRFSMSRIFQRKMDPADLIRLLEARLHQRPLDCLGHIDFSLIPPGSMYWPRYNDYWGLSEKLLSDYILLCSDADVGRLNMLGLVTKMLSESLELRLVDWIRSILPDLHAQILGQPQHEEDLDPQGIPRTSRSSADDCETAQSINQEKEERSE